VSAKRTQPKARKSKDILLKVDGDEVIKTMAPLFKKAGKPKAYDGKVALGFQDGYLVFTGYNFEVRISAAGHWPGRLLISPPPLLRALKALPPIKDVPLRWTGQRLQIMGRTVPANCEFQPAAKLE
jgi:hypothetical protein